MVKVDLCLIGTGLFGGMLYTNLAKYDSHSMNEFQYSLSADQQRIYVQIIKERSDLFIQGLLIGTIVSLLFIKFFTNNLEPWITACTTSSIAMAVTFFYYILMPKKYRMVTVLRNKTQLDLWNKVYVEMQHRYWLGFLLGITGFAFLSYGFLDGLKTIISEQTDMGIKGFDQLAESLGISLS